MDRINIGIVGTGWWASVHANAIKKGKFLKLVACYSRTKEKAKEFAVKNDCEVVSDYMSLIKRTDIDAIIITTPHTTHPELAIKAAQAGKHVLIEKPLALNVKDCKRIIEAFEDAGLVLAVGHDRRWYGSHMKMKELIEKGVIGKKIFGEGNYFHYSGLKLTPDLWRWYKSESPGGSLSYLGIHMIDTLRFLIGEIVEVNGKVDKLETKAEIYDTALATFRFDNGAYGFVGSIFVVPKVTMVNVYGTKASLYSSDKLGLYIQRIESEELEKIQYNEVDPVLLEQEDFARSVIEKRKPLVDGYEGMRNVAIMEAIIKSSQDKRPVEVREILN